MSITEEDAMHTHSQTKALSKILLNSVTSCSLKCQIYNKLNPKLFDVSLRDGIQSADPAKYTTPVKKQIFQNIFKRYNPASIEVGSIVSSKVLPIMADTVNLHEYITNELDKHYSTMAPYVLIPNNARLKDARMNGIRNFSFITSVSNAFQLKNTRNTIVQTKEELKIMEATLNCYRLTHNRKLYISCINECPIEGKVDNDFIVHEILHYHTNYQFTEICLSDTMGTLTYDDFEYIVDTILYFGLPAYKISLHLHMSNSNTDEIRRILYYCFDKNINKFDVSLLTDGGCSVTMGKTPLPNLTYHRFYEILEKYIIREVS
jgi:HMGL-like